MQEKSESSMEKMMVNLYWYSDYGLESYLFTFQDASKVYKQFKDRYLIHARIINIDPDQGISGRSWQYIRNAKQDQSAKNIVQSEISRYQDERRLFCRVCIWQGYHQSLGRV